jgi:putative dimethyl sulfoxide reductase chaperone
MLDSEIAQTLWLTLAHAFMPPVQQQSFAACRDFLADDLAEICASMQLAADGDIADLRRAMTRMATAEDLLVDYSHLFLQAPIPATLNLGRYVDGSLNGPCLDALEDAYRAAGVEKREDLHDLGDHAVMQMECLAFLIGQDDQSAISAEDFAQVCLVGALPRLAASVAAESPASPYAALTRIAARASDQYARATGAPESATARRTHRHDTSRGVWRLCQSCGKPIAREKEIQIMGRALEQAGLPADHLGLCPDCRDAKQGFFRRQIK